MSLHNCRFLSKSSFSMETLHGGQLKDSKHFLMNWDFAEMSLPSSGISDIQMIILSSEALRTNVKSSKHLFYRWLWNNSLSLFTAHLNTIYEPWWEFFSHTSAYKRKLEIKIKHLNYLNIWACDGKSFASGHVVTRTAKSYDFCSNGKIVFAFGHARLFLERQHLDLK